MTDAQKIQQLTELLTNVIHTLDLKQFDVEDPTLSHQCEVEAGKFYQQMIDILHSNA